MGLDGDLRGLRVGIPTGFLMEAADAPIQAAVEAGVAVLAARGASVVRIDLPLMEAVSAYVGIVSRVEGATIHARWMRERPQDYAPSLAARLYAGSAIPATYYVEALSRRGPILRRFAAEVFGRVDVLAMPTIAMVLPTRAATDIDGGDESAIPAYNAVLTNTRPFNYLGLPALSAPCGFDPNGLPVGLQLVARPFAEALLLKVADAYQRDTAWHAMRPPVGAAA